MLVVVLASQHAEAQSLVSPVVWVSESQIVGLETFYNGTIAVTSKYLQRFLLHTVQLPFSNELYHAMTCDMQRRQRNSSCYLLSLFNIILDVCTALVACLLVSAWLLKLSTSYGETVSHFTLRRIMHTKRIVALLLLLASAAAEARSLRAESQCPPPGLDSVKDFDLQAYIAAPW
jgi:hypothetical protein